MSSTTSYEAVFLSRSHNSAVFDHSSARPYSLHLRCDVEVASADDEEDDDEEEVNEDVDAVEDGDEDEDEEARDDPDDPSKMG